MSDGNPNAIKCIFTDDTLTEDTKPEHVLQNALGGRKTTRRVICSECNNRFGGGIDKKLTDQAEVIRNLLQMHSGAGNSAPMIRNLKAGSHTVNARGDGTLELVTKPFITTKLPNGSFEVQITARSLDEIDKIVPHIAATIRIPEAEIRQQLAQAPVRLVEERPGPIPFRLVFGGEDALRSAAKSCLVLWALKVGNDEVRGQPYEAARDFVINGGETFRQTRSALDSRPLADIDMLQKEYGPLFNLIYVQSNEDGRVIGHFTFYNIIAMHIILAESGGSPNLKIGLVSNPLDPKVWSDEIADLLNIRTEWLNAHEYDIPVAKERFSMLMQTYVDIATPKELNRIVMDVFANRGIGENDPVPPSALKELVSELGDRLARHMLALPFDKAIGPDQLNSILRDNKTKQA